jgi:hypothetical protein
MLSIINAKYNIISNLEDNNITEDFDDLRFLILEDNNNITEDNNKMTEDYNDIKNFIKYYFEENKYIILPDYINNLLNHYRGIDYINVDTIAFSIIYPNIDNLILDNNINYLKKKKKEIILNIKNNNYSVNELNNFIEYYIKYIKNIVNIIYGEKKNINNILLNFDKEILSNSKLHIFLQKEFNKMKNGDNINLLLINIKKINNNHQWFLKLIKNYIEKNIEIINYPIPEKYNKINEINYLIDYFNEIYNKFIFLLHAELINITTFIIDKIKSIVVELLNDHLNNYLIIEMVEIFKKLYNFIIKINEDHKYIIKFSLSNYIYSHFKNINKLNDGEINDLLLLLSNNIKLIETNSYIFDSLNQDLIYNKLNDNIINNILLIKYIKDKTTFFDIYRKNLIKRLLSNNFNIDKEENICLLFENAGYIRNIYKIKKIIHDVVKSKLSLNDFNRKNKINLDLIITSYGNWDINYNNGYILKFDNQNLQLFNYLSKFNTFYENENNNKKLMYLFQYGEINITFEQDANKFIEITLLPIQLLVLELFDTYNKIIIDDIMKQSFFNNYSNEFKIDIINSIIISDIVYNNNNILSLNKSSNINPDFINIYKNNSLNNRIIKFNENALTEENVMSCWVNHLIKIKSENFENLLILLNNNINNFEIDNIKLSKVLNSMIDKDYIKLDENTNEYIKLYY